MRDGQFLSEHELKDPITFNLSANQSFIEMSALKHCGAGLVDFEAYYKGDIDPDFLQVLVTFYQASNLYQTHVKDIVAIEQERRMELARNKAKK